MTIKEPILNYWYRALHSSVGIEVSCSDAEKIRARLYTARLEAKDPDLHTISICKSPFDPMKLWFIKKGPKDETP